MRMHVPYVVAFLVSMCCFPTGSDAGTYLYDSFSEEHINLEKWSFDSPYGTWNCNEVQKGIVAGQYVSQVRSDNAFGRSRLASREMPFTSCQVDMKLGDPGPLDTGNNTEVEAELGVPLYNADSATPSGNTGNIWGSIELQYNAKGLEAVWYVWKSLDDDLKNLDLLDTGVFTPSQPLQFDNFYQASMSYDSTADQITFEMAGDSRTSTILPEKKGPAYGQRISLLNTINSDIGGTVRSTDAAFDNVIKDGALFDDFGTAPIDHTKWIDLEVSRRINNKKLELGIRGHDYRHQVTAYATQNTAPFFQADVRVSSDYQLPAGQSGIARVGGTFFNDTHGPGEYNGYEGEIFAQVRLTLQDDQLTAYAWLERSDDPDWSTYSFPYPVTAFQQSLGLDTAHTLSIHYTASNRTFTFKVNDETQTFTLPPTMNVFPAFQPDRQLRTRVYLNSGQQGYMTAFYDNVVLYRADIIGPQMLLLGE